MSRLDELFAAAHDEVIDNSFAAVKAWRDAEPGRGAVGCFPVYVPQEVIWAAGALPVEIWGGGERIEVELADARVQSFICSISRSTLELGLLGNLDFLDGMLFSSLCDVARNLSGVWKRNFPDKFVDYLHYPQNLKSAAARDYYSDDLRRLAKDIGALTGHTASDADLDAAIDVYEQQRGLLRQLDTVRREEPWRLSLKEWYLMVRVAGRRAPDAHNAVLTEVLELLQQRDCRPKDGVRVVLEGSFCEQPALELLRTLDQAHCFVVDSDLARGLHWFKEPLSRSGNPWQDMVEAFFTHAEASVVRHFSPSERSGRLVERVKASDAIGVIFCTAKFCEPAFYDFVLHKRALESHSIPFMAVEFEEKMGSFESIRTQAETFSESILFFTEEVMA